MTDAVPELAVKAAGPAELTTVPFKIEGQPQVAVIVKASFLIVRDGAAILASPDRLVRADEHIHGDAERSLLAASDLVPYRPRADVLLSGHARAPLGQAAPWVGVRLMVARGGAMCIDKSLLVRGPPDPGSPDRAPQPFHSVLLAYELAGGGDENPARALDGGEWPRVLDRWHRAFPLGFGPLGRIWPARQRILPDARLTEEPVPDFPKDFPWAYFNVAPLDQRIDHLQGDEWIGFEGFHSQFPRVQTYLPRARGVARVYGPTPDLAAGAEVELRADTLLVNADRMRISVVWRGRFALPAGVDAASLLVVGAVEVGGRPVDLPASHEAAMRFAPWRDTFDGDAGDAPDTQDPESQAPPSMPFARPVIGGGDPEDIEPAPNTVDFSDDLAAVARSAAAMPFARSLPGSPSPGPGPAGPFDRLALMGSARALSPPPFDAESADDLLPEAPGVIEPPPLLGAPPDAVAEPESRPEARRTLGAFFLAAMARRGARPDLRRLEGSARSAT